ncbi:restriction endonuclease [Salinimicrobium sp. TH3]|uniref:restriction endonuclease n=1 Tax=Salinimicrobium sp. TH3 TaxID=2997342 RepID=UPI002276412C|nr:restriction endonuclease [Salinimicrobium sp. TH3]MCY2687582.1 restriction endonuclease [Salinimicrobium sp. TH3]
MDEEYDFSDCPEPENFLSTRELQKMYSYQPSQEECINNYKYGQCGGSCNKDFLNEITLYIILEHLDSFGLQEYKTETTEEINGEIIKITKAIKGFYYDEKKAVGIIHSSTNYKLLPQNLVEKISDLIEVTHLYEGESYLLAKTEDKIFGFNIRNYQKIKDVIQTIDYEYDLSIAKKLVSSDGIVLVLIGDEGTKFIIMGLLGEDFEKEERVTLSQKVESSKPFFEFEPYTKVDWSQLKDTKGTTFEGLCEVLLQNEKGIIDVQTIGKPNAADRGRDFIIVQEVYNISGKKEEKWLVQCKFSKHSISPATISGWTDRVVEHNVDGYWLMTNNDITPSLYDQLNDSNKNEKFNIKTKIWPRNKFDIQFNLQKELFSKEFFKEK